MFYGPSATYSQSTPCPDHDATTYSDFDEDNINNSNIILFNENEKENGQSPGFTQSSGAFPESFTRNEDITDSYCFNRENNEQINAPDYPLKIADNAINDPREDNPSAYFNSSKESIIFLIKRIHYNNIIRRNVNGQTIIDNLNVPPWIGITIDEGICNRTPILFGDGGMIVTHGQLELHNKDIDISDDKSKVIHFDGNLNNFNAKWLIPRVTGTVPDAAPFLLSEFKDSKEIIRSNMNDQEKRFRFSKNEMLKMLWKMIIDLGINPNLNINFNILTKEENY